jgi:hypothetical protein
VWIIVVDGQMFEPSRVEESCLGSARVFLPWLPQKTAAFWLPEYRAKPDQRNIPVASLGRAIPGDSSCLDPSFYALQCVPPDGGSERRRLFDLSLFTGGSS